MSRKKVGYEESRYNPRWAMNGSDTVIRTQKWTGVGLVGQEDLAALDKSEIDVPEELLDLLVNYGGGIPTLNTCTCKENEVLELGVGYVLPIRPDGRKLTFSKAVIEYRKFQKLPEFLLPFALDTGNSGLICYDRETGRVVYWNYGERVKLVCNELSRFIETLGPRPA